MMATKILSIYFNRSIDMGRIGGGHATYVMNDAVGGVRAEFGTLEGKPGFIIRNTNVTGKPEMFLADTSATVSHIVYERTADAVVKK